MKNLLRISITIILFLTFPCELMCAQQNKPVLPNVIIIGDSVYYHAYGVSKELKDRANIHYIKWPKGVLPNSTNAIKHIDLLLGLKDAAGKDVPEYNRRSWDGIHFNVGLGDLIYSVPNIKSHRVLPYNAGGVIRTDAKQYEKNLNTLIQLFRQKAPNAKIIWASTTPIRHSREKVFKLGTEIKYNQIAERVMKKHNVPINDMYDYVIKHINMDKPAGHGADPYHFDRKPLHPPIVDIIAGELKLPVKKPEEAMRRSNVSEK